MSFSMVNIIIIVLLSITVFVFLYLSFMRGGAKEEKAIEEDCFSLSYLKEAVKIRFNEIVNQNIAGLYLSREETKKREFQKARLKTALRCCAQGNIGDKEFVKDYIKDLLQSVLNINEDTIDRIIPFDKPENQTAQDMFEIMLRQYRKDYYYDAFEKLSKACGFEKEKSNTNGSYYEVTGKDIDEAYGRLAVSPSYVDKLEIVTQRIYQEVYGFSVVDEIRDMRIDGCSGGVSGITSQQYHFMEEILQNDRNVRDRTYDSIWVFLHGKPIRLSFLSFGSMGELIRVCRNLYRNENVGHLTSSNGYKLTYLQDGSRVVVVRPKLTNSWAFFLRKFDSAGQMPINELIRDRGKEAVIELVKWVVKGCLNIVISGDQNSGKTTFLKAMIQFFDQRCPIRTTEQEFELWIGNTYPKLNVACFRGSEEVSLIDSIDIQKKTDGAIMILGEVASPRLADAFISLTQAGTRSTMCTCHCVTTKDLVDYFRNSILSSGTFSNELVAEEQIANSINLDIHWEKTEDGHRYISHITEILPLSGEETWPEDPDTCMLEVMKRLVRRKTYITRDLIVYENGEYIAKNSLSERSVIRICKYLKDTERDAFLKFNRLLGGEV